MKPYKNLLRRRQLPMRNLRPLAKLEPTTRWAREWNGTAPEWTNLTSTTMIKSVNYPDLAITCIQRQSGQEWCPLRLSRPSNCRSQKQMTVSARLQFRKCIHRPIRTCRRQILSSTWSQTISRFPWPSLASTSLTYSMLAGERRQQRLLQARDSITGFLSLQTSSNEKILRRCVCNTLSSKDNLETFRNSFLKV